MSLNINVKNLFSGKKPKPWPDLVLPMHKQIRRWRIVNRQRRLGIPGEEFAQITSVPALTDNDLKDGYVGSILSYGFGDNGSGFSDPVLSGKVAWLHAVKQWWLQTWQCKYIDFDKKDHIRLRPSSQMRPKGFYFAKFKPGTEFISWTVSKFIKTLPSGTTGMGPEGIQFLTITHTHIPKLMNQRKLPFMTFFDYDIAPYGYNDFFDSVQMFNSIDTLGLGIGNVDQNYPLFCIPSLRF